MKPHTYVPISHERLASANLSDTQTASIPKGTSAVEITVETTNCRATFTAAGDPTSSTGLILQKDWSPWFFPVGQGATLRFASIAGTQSVIQILYIQ